MISAKDAQPWKAHAPIAARAGGSVILAKDAQPWKARAPIAARAGGSVIFAKEVQCPNVSLTITFVPIGTVTANVPCGPSGCCGSSRLRGDVPARAHAEQQVLQVRLVGCEQHDQMPERRRREQLAVRSGGGDLCGGIEHHCRRRGGIGAPPLLFLAYFLKTGTLMTDIDTGEPSN